MPIITPSAVEACVNASAAMLDLSLSPEYRPGVLRFFSLAAEMAALVEAVPLDPHVDPAVTFVPVAPREPGE